VATLEREHPAGMVSQRKAVLHELGVILHPTVRARTGATSPVAPRLHASTDACRPTHAR
jgi:hypothetical protein